MGACIKLAAIVYLFSSLMLSSAKAEGSFTKVTEGVFTLVAGKATDITDSKILLYLDKEYGSAIGHEQGSLNGQFFQMAVGTRIDLRKNPATSGSVSGRDHCLLDVVGMDKPNGGRVQVTFRLDCF